MCVVWCGWAGLGCGRVCVHGRAELLLCVIQMVGCPAASAVRNCCKWQNWGVDMSPYAHCRFSMGCWTHLCTQGGGAPSTGASACVVQVSFFPRSWLWQALRNRLFTLCTYYYHTRLWLWDCAAGPSGIARLDMRTVECWTAAGWLHCAPVSWGSALL
jgi:hypothetical protein